MELQSAFARLAEPAERRDGAVTEEVNATLLGLWGEVRERLGAERFDAVLGDLRAGRPERRSHGAWAQTNAEHPDGDYVNLTLEIEPEELSLNVIGWFDPQLEKVEGWLRRRDAWRFMRTLEHWYLVVFVRDAHVGKSGRPNFRGARGEERERIALSDTAPANVAAVLTGLRPRLDPGLQKPSVHIRRPWSPSEVEALDDVPGALAGEVERWLDPLESIRLG